MSLADRTAAFAERLQAITELPRLRGARVQLRGPRDGDAERVFALFSDPGTMRYWSRPPMRRHDEALAYVASIDRGVAEHTYLNWLISAPDDDRMLGTCTLYDLQAPHLRAGIGYALLPAARGRGLASEAVALALDYAFGVLGANRIEADAHPDNTASRRLLDRLGFGFEGILRQRFVTASEIQDSAIYGLLAEDWPGRG